MGNISYDDCNGSPDEKEDPRQRHDDIGRLPEKGADRKLIDYRSKAVQAVKKSRGKQKHVNDDMKDAFFLPVDNIVPVDRLLKKVEKYQQERDQSKQDLDQARQKIKELQDELDRVKRSRA